MDRRQAMHLMGMPKEQYEAEIADGNVAIKYPWAVTDVGSCSFSMVASCVLLFDASIRVACSLEDLHADLARELKYAHERLSEEYLWYEHERIADLHASLMQHCKGPQKFFHMTSANAHHFAFKAANACAHAETDGTHDLLSAFASCAALGHSLQERPTQQIEWLWHAAEVAAHRCISKCKDCDPGLPR